MTTTLAPAAQWAKHEFGFAQLWDRRRNKRLVNVATNLALNPGGTLPQAFPQWAELKGAYRLFDQPQLTHANLLAPHLENTLNLCRQTV